MRGGDVLSSCRLDRAHQHIVDIDRRGELSKEGLHDRCSKRRSRENCRTPLDGVPIAYVDRQKLEDLISMLILVKDKILIVCLFKLGLPCKVLINDL